MTSQKTSIRAALSGNAIGPWMTAIGVALWLALVFVTIVNPEGISMLTPVSLAIVPILLGLDRLGYLETMVAKNE